jgi:4-hydroxy-3-polyprenylbenzoate decarboxylase
VDDLDDAALYPAFGGKMGIDATRKWPSEGFTREWPKRLATSKEAAAKAEAIWARITSGR